MVDDEYGIKEPAVFLKLKVRRCLTSEVSKTIATALVSSRLDYCSDRLYNVTNQELNQLHGVQNCLALAVTRSPRFSRTTPHLKSLHWLPVCFRIKFKICLVTFKALCNNQPIYLKKMLKSPKRTRGLRSSDQNVLFVPRIETKKGEGSFSVTAPKLWDHLSVKLELQKQFTLSEKKLKLFFNQAFPTWFFFVLACSVGDLEWKNDYGTENLFWFSRLWARDTEDLGALEFYICIHSFIYSFIHSLNLCFKE